MAYDPDYPPAHSKIRSAEMRTQFNGLKDLIDAVPAGPPGADGQDGQDGEPGEKGDKGDPFANAVVDEVTLLPAGEQPTVSVTFDGTDVHFTFGIPQGESGGQGEPGEVTAAQLDAAIAGTSGNTNVVEPLEPGATLGDVIAKLNELILGLRR